MDIDESAISTRQNEIKMFTTRSSKAKKFQPVVTSLTNDEICQKIKAGVFEIKTEKYKEKYKNRSAAWKIIGSIFCNNQILKDKVACRNCFAVLNYKYQWGTSNLIAHLNGCGTRRKFSEELSTASVVADIKRNVKTDIVRFVCQDLRAFKTVSGEGFISLADKLISIGARFGENLSAREILPHPTTVSRAIHQMADEHRATLKEKLASLIEDGIGVTLDLWTENYKQRTYININVHFIDNVMQERTLCVKNFDEFQKTGANIFAEVSNVLKEFGIDNMKDAIFVTDRASNMKLALTEQTRLDCAAHMVNSIVSKMFSEASNLELKITLRESRSLVTYVKKSNIQSELQVTLKAESVTRWSGKYPFSAGQCQSSILNFSFQVSTQ